MGGEEDHGAVPLRAALVVESHELSLAEITAALGCDPDAGHERGSLGALRPQPRERSCWEVSLAWPTATHAGTEGLSQAIEGLGIQLAERLAALGGRGCGVVLSVVQELADDSASTGLHLSVAAVQWLAAAGAVVDVDQYVHQVQVPTSRR